MKQNVLLLLALAAMFGCSKSERLPNDDANGLSIQLSGRINDTGVTRGAGVVEGTLPTSILTVNIFRADKNGSYPGTWVNEKGDEVITGYINSLGHITLAPIQNYLSDAAKTSRFIGVYPPMGNDDVYDDDARTITYDALDGAMDVMCSDFAEGHKDVETDPLLTFSHLLTKIEVWLKVEDADPNVIEKIINSWGKVSSITVKDKKTDAVVTLPAPNTDNAVTIEAATVETDDLALWTIDGLAPASVLLSATETVFGYAMFLPSDAEETLTLTITFSDGRTVDVETSTPQQYLAGKGCKITVLFKKADDISAQVVQLDGLFGLWTDDTGNQTEDKKVGMVTPQTPTNVEDGLSNTYLVASGSTVRFEVSRAYNHTDEGFTRNLRVDGAEYTDTFDIAVVWADTENLFETLTVTGSGKNAVVAVKAKSGLSGNAVVALKKAKTENIVWSYHIWVTGYDPDAGADAQYVNTENGFIFMDRNLGATEAGTGSGLGKGLFYQWGRKDPFPATGAPGANQPGGGSFTTAATSEITGTIANTIKNPNVFITASASPNDWYHGDTRNDELWGHSGLKRIYDPCPAGWRVPVNSGSSEATSPWAGFTNSNGGTFSAGYSWDDKAKYPAAGRRSQDAGVTNSTDVNGFYWCATSSGANGLHLFFSSSAVLVAGSNTRASGYPVRCVKE